MDEEKRQGADNDDDGPIDPSFLAQVTRKIASYQQAVIVEKKKMSATVFQVTSELGSYAVVEDAKREHNEQLVNGTLAVEGPGAGPLPTGQGRQH